MSSIKNFFYIAARIEICYTFPKINVTVQPCAGLGEKACCKLACISVFSSKSAYGGSTMLLVFMNMETRRCMAEKIINKE